MDTNKPNNNNDNGNNTNNNENSTKNSTNNEKFSLNPKAKKSSSTSSLSSSSSHSSRKSSKNGSKTYLVTGAAGFVGSHLVLHLLKSLNTFVIAIDIAYPATNDMLLFDNCSFILCDITRYNEVYRAFGGYVSRESNSCAQSSSKLVIDCVFHCAALTDAMVAPSLYWKVNVEGTSNVIRACQQFGISKLVYTSSSCVVLDGTDCQNGDESMKYASSHLSAYSYSKQMAEERVLQSNKKCSLLTCALRPHQIFGPRDSHFIAQIILKAKDGKISHMIGEGHNITDFTYIDNVVHAHVLAANKLSTTANGQVYFITNGEPTLFWSFIASILMQLGCARPNKYISYNVAYAIALLMEFIYWVIGWLFGWKPLITRQMVVTMAQHHWFSHAKATRDLGYKPIVTLEDGIKKYVEYLQKTTYYNKHTNNNNNNNNNNHDMPNID